MQMLQRQGRGTRRQARDATPIMHCVQATPGATLRGIAASAPSIGRRGLYRGIVPAFGGACHEHFWHLLPQLPPV